jgi:hypothetical protein
MTKYTILKNFGGDKVTANDEWHTVGEAEAVSANAAIRSHLNGASEGGEFVAVPSRSWAPVKVEIQQAIKIS